MVVHHGNITKKTILSCLNSVLVFVSGVTQGQNKKISRTPPVLAEERKNNNMKKNGAVSVYTHCHEEQPCQIRFPKSKDYAETFRISNASPVAGTSP